jgi:hypothetical protein
MVPQYAGYSVYADLKIGSNGNDEGVSELTAADASGAAAYGHTTWDEDVSDGVDSGWVQVQLVAGPSGVTWTVGNRPPVQVADSVGGEVLSLKVRAAVSGANRQSSWRDLVASFYDSADADLSQPQEQMMLARSRTPVASTMDAADPTAEADQVTDIIPEGSGYSKMMLTASVRIESLSGIIPSPDSMFGQVYLYTSPQPVAPPPPTETTAVYVAVAPQVTATTDTSVVEITNFTDALSADELALLS